MKNKKDKTSVRLLMDPNKNRYGFSMINAPLSEKDYKVEKFTPRRVIVVSRAQVEPNIIMPIVEWNSGKIPRRFLESF